MHLLRMQKMKVKQNSFCYKLVSSVVNLYLKLKLSLNYPVIEIEIEKPIFELFHNPLRYLD